MKETIEVFVGSGNVFADLALPNPEELQLKADLAIQIRRVMEDERLTHEQAAEKMGLDQVDFSRLLEGPSADFTIDQLFRCLNRLGRRIEVRISTQDASPQAATLTVIAA